MSERDEALNWVESDGGPLVILPIEISETWSGTDGIDYETACRVGDPYVGVIERNGLGILVLGGEPLSTAWVQDVGIIRWIQGLDERQVQSVIRLPDTVDDLGEEGIVRGFRTGPSGECLLQDSAYLVGELTAMKIVIPPGEYVVTTQIWSSRDGMNRVIVHGFMR